jgi:DNA-binding transcriptional ArsR family regulator
VPRKQKVQAKPKDSNVEALQPLLEAMTTLLGRFVYPPDKLRDIVMKRKRNPEAYVRAYNLCDGMHTVTQIADAIGVSQPTLSTILPEWKELGIVYEVSTSGGKFYKKLYKLNLPRETEEEGGEPSEPAAATSLKPPEATSPDTLETL